MDVIRKYFAATVLVTVFSVPMIANAALVEVDWQITGDYLITRDTISGLDWLDLTETNNMSRNYVLTQLGSGGQFDGWRYASSAETVALWANFGVDLSTTPLGPTSGLDPSIVIAAETLGGILDEPSLPYWTLGLTSDNNPMNTFHYARLGALYISDFNWTIFSGVDGEYIATYDANEVTSHYLVQTSPVPVPAAVWLFGSGLLGLISVAKRKKAYYL